MRGVEDPKESQQVPAHKVFSYEKVKPAIGETLQQNYRGYTIKSNGTVLEETGAVLTLGRRFFLISGHCLGQTEYQNGKLVFRCANCGTYRVATASSPQKVKFYILGWFMHNECNA